MLSYRHYTLFPAVRNISASRSLLSVGFMEMKWQLILDLKGLEEHPEESVHSFAKRTRKITLAVAAEPAARTHLANILDHPLNP